MVPPKGEQTGGRQQEEEVQGQEAGERSQPARMKMRMMKRMKLPGDAGERTRRSPQRNVAVVTMMTARTRLPRGSGEERPIRRKEAKPRTVMMRTAMREKERRGRREERKEGKMRRRIVRERKVMPKGRTRGKTRTMTRRRRRRRTTGRSEHTRGESSALMFFLGGTTDNMRKNA